MYMAASPIFHPQEDFQQWYLCPVLLATKPASVWSRKASWHLPQQEHLGFHFSKASIPISTAPCIVTPLSGLHYFPLCLQNKKFSNIHSTWQAPPCSCKTLPHSHPPPHSLQAEPLSLLQTHPRFSAHVTLASLFPEGPFQDTYLIKLSLSVKGELKFNLFHEAPPSSTQTGILSFLKPFKEQTSKCGGTEGT